MAKDTFIFYVDWYETIEDINQESLRARLYQAIPRYAFTGQEPEDEATRIVFGFIKRQLDRDSQKYEAKIEKRREAGRKGNEKRWGKKEETSQSIANVANAINASQSIANVADNVNGNVNVNDNKDLKETSKEEKKVIATAVATLPKRQEEFYKSLVPYVECYGKDMVRAFYDYWTEPNKSRSKMRFELEKTWDLKRRLATWANREKTNSNGNNRNNTTQEQRANEVAGLVEELLAGNG